jgi:catechol 2,3-dioxygenase-like lactoylglutathione lyase family enzyme
MITGAHSILYSDKADEVRRFLADVLGFRNVDVGGGWLVFAMPPAELAVHPSEGSGVHELYLLCDNLEDTMNELRALGVEFGPVHEERWGIVSSIKLPDGSDLPIYEPKHTLAI